MGSYRMGKEIMELRVQRDKVTPKSVSGQLSIDRIFECFTVEPGAQPVNVGHPTIPAGRYKVILTKSPHLGYVTPEVLDVPGRTAIRIHIANFVTELLGCTAVGRKRSLVLMENEWAVWDSAIAFEALMVKLRAATGEIWIEYLDPTPDAM